MKIVGVYPDSFEASLARGRLEEAGIEVCLLNEYINSVIPYAPQEEREVKLAVADEDYEAAMKMLGRSSQSGGGLGKGKVCPFCGSERVTFGLKGPSRWKKIATAVVETLTMAPAGNLRCLYYCQDCKREF
ncbi:DUF2007 domain-containing protein [uncultured Rikenella sp.]|uniref:putative signal transducing protein n=1 Tax=uncultured Rikenella sp. TaxID=368003 RepID=UPI002620E8D2|nr:DUF2007 domain-containing protein [uncultured Rikenella sp.]